MKKIKSFSVLLVSLSVILVSCEKDSEDVCSKFDSPNCSTLVFTVCSDGDNEYLQYEGKDYPCVVQEGEEDICDNEADEIIQLAGCDKSVANVKSANATNKSFVLNAVRKIRAEAMAAAGCN